MTGERRSLGHGTSVEDQIQDLLHNYPYEFTAGLLTEGARILEVGFGWGEGARILQGKGTQYDGIEVSEEAVELAKRRHPLPGTAFHHYDGETFPFEDQTFDIVLSSHVLEHVVDPDGYLAEIKRVTRPGGTIVVVTPNSLHRLRPGERPWNRFHLKEFDGPEFEELFRRHFPNPRFRGVDGSDSMNSVEMARVARARKLAKMDPLGLRYVLPETLMFWIRKGLGALARAFSKNSTVVTPSMEEVHLSDENWEKSIHLMAIVEVESKDPAQN